MYVTQLLNGNVVFGAVVSEGGQFNAKYTPDGLVFGS